MVRLALASLFLFAFCGCSVAPPSPLGDDPDIQALAPKVKAQGKLPRLALAPIQIDYPLQFDLVVEPGRMPLSPDRPALSLALAQDIASYTAFGRPVLLTEEERTAAAARAASEGAEILVLPKLTKCEVFFDRRNSKWIWNVMLWLYFWFPAWFVPDEDYGVEMGLELTYVSVASERVIHRSMMSAKHIESLDDFDRGWDFLGIFRVPTALEADQLRKVSDLLYPHARRDLERKVVLELGGAFPAALADEERRPEIERADASVTALLVGIGKYQDDARIAAPPGTASDLRLVEDLLRDGEGVPAKNVLTLEGRAATRFRIEQALTDHLGKRARPQDTLLVYFSGVGAASPSGTAAPDCYLLPHDANPDDPARTAISLRALCDRLRALPARRAIVIVDAGFGPAAGGTRSLRGAVAPKGPPPLDAVAAMTRTGAGKEIVLLTATLGGEGAGAGEDALDLAESKRGLFTFLLCEGARGRADADASGDVSLVELGAYAARHVKAQAGLEGVIEAPALFRLGSRVPIGAPSGGPAWLPRARDVKGL